MSTPILFNFRLIDDPTGKRPAHIADVALSQFGLVESGLQLRCEFNPQETAKWGVYIVDVRGGDFGYFTALAGRDLERNPDGSLAEDPNKIEKYRALSNAVSFMLNEWFGAYNDRPSHVKPEELAKVLAEEVFALSQDHAIKDELVVYLIQTGLKQKDVMLALAKASDFFRYNIPAYHLRGNGEAGEINDVVEEIEPEKLPSMPSASNDEDAK
ncbi:MAG: hypothetical protein CL840_04480 [Crocinitomicaceae bacterium]|nr:hypothetical protein [Crocinitomicaceae bacterium]|tara:strand:- start:71462 stop:72100 length:639 start_codon:yes stop_codon:yes gene_type:complete